MKWWKTDADETPLASFKFKTDTLSIDETISPVFRRDHARLCFAKQAITVQSDAAIEPA